MTKKAVVNTLKTADDVIEFKLYDDGSVVAHDVETNKKVTLAVDGDGLKEVIDLLTKLKTEVDALEAEDEVEEDGDEDAEEEEEEEEEEDEDAEEEEEEEEEEDE